MFSLENRIAQKAPIVNDSISQALLIDSLPDENSKLVDSVAEDMLKASSYLLNFYCKNTAISNKDCVKFMSKYTIPESTNLSTRCQENNSIYIGYRRMLHATYQDSLQRVRASLMIFNEKFKHSGRHFELTVEKVSEKKVERKIFRFELTSQTKNFRCRG